MKLQMDLASSLVSMAVQLIWDKKDYPNTNEQIKIKYAL